MARDNEVLLRELYHRTKNNMQVVASMLALKRFGVESGETAALLQDLEARIYAIALVHQKLYHSHDLSRIDLADYLTELIEQIDASYGFRERGIALDTNLESASAIIDQAVPVGLALNELLSNAIKHAFVGRQRGAVFVTLRMSGDTIVMVVSDDGVGIGPEAGSDPSHIGLQTLHALVEMQLDGTIECSVNGGTRWTLRIPKRENDTND
jgi:two-component sensor histidine kinase